MTTPTHAGVSDRLTKLRDDFKRSGDAEVEITLHAQPLRYYADLLTEALVLLAGPARPDGVPDDAVPLTIWFTPDDRDGMTRGYAPDGGEITLGFSLGETWRFRSVPVPPFEPAPEPVDPEQLLVKRETVAEHFNGHCCSDDPECEHSFLDTDDLARHMASEYQPDPEQLLIDKIAATYPPTDPADSPTHKCVAHPDDGHCVECGERCRENAPAAAGERTGPLDGYPHLALLETRERVREVAAITDDELSLLEITALTKLVEACRAAVAEWDAEPQPAETLDDIVAELRHYGRLNWADRVEAASRPDPDTITVNRDDLRRVLDWIGRMDGQDAGPYMSVLRLSRALAAAELPQEPTAVRRRPSLDEQRSHLDEGSCGCHDSWDQCPCAEGGHPADGSCNCCPLGTGLCGPLPWEPTEPETQR